MPNINKFEAWTEQLDRDIAALRDAWVEAGRDGEPDVRVLVAKRPTPEDLEDWSAAGASELIWGVPDADSATVLAYLDKLAGRLGLVHKREGLPADYAKTLLGSWIQHTLGIAIAADNMAAILRVFKILGAEASYA